MARARCLAGLVCALDDARAVAYEATTDAAKLWTSPQVKAVVKAQPVCEQHDADTAEHERAANTGNARIARVVCERTAACAEARVDHTRHADAATAHADNAAGGDDFEGLPVGFCAAAASGTDARRLARPRSLPAAQSAPEAREACMEALMEA